MKYLILIKDILFWIFALSVNGIIYFLATPYFAISGLNEVKNKWGSLIAVAIREWKYIFKG